MWQSKLFELNHGHNGFAVRDGPQRRAAGQSFSRILLAPGLLFWKPWITESTFLVGGELRFGGEEDGRGGQLRMTRFTKINRSLNSLVFSVSPRRMKKATPRKAEKHGIILSILILAIEFFAGSQDNIDLRV